MTRHPHALVEYLEDRESWTFSYGGEPRSHDCARFASGGVKAVTGVDPLNAFSGQWSTEQGARRVIARHGGMVAAVSEVMTPVPPTLAQRGDVGLTAENTLVLVEGEMVVGLSPERGQVRQPRLVMTHAWTVG